MTYRDDHEAALARVAALERELARQQADDQDREREVATLARTLAAARAELDRVTAELEDVKRAEPAPRPPARDRAPVGPIDQRARPVRVALIAGAIAVAALAAVLVLVASSGGSSDTSRPAPDAAFLDAADLIAEARARAEHELPGAWVVSIHLAEVDSQARLPLRGGWFAIELLRPPGTEHCFVLTHDTWGWYDKHAACAVSPQPGWAPAPRCTVAEIWARAIADGASSALTAKIRFDGHWVFELAGTGQPSLREFVDDCALESPTR